jgi:NADH-quinone oxidoreductase subunit H
MLFVIVEILKIFLIVIPLLISVAYFTLAERKIMGGIQRRRGPNVVGLFGLLQPLADGLKLFIKETILPSNANIVLFIIAPIITFLLSLIGWSIIPFDNSAVFADLNVGIAFLFGVSSLGIYGIIIAGWSSNSKYAFLGALRSAAQMVSYEVSLGLIIINVLLLSGSLNLSNLVLSQESVWFLFPLFPMFILFFVSCLAETNRHPFDLPEAEAELVSGYNVEYSAMTFALFFLGEYANMLLMSSMCVILFMGGWLAPWPFTFLNVFCFGSFWFGLKICFFVLLFIWSRAAFPRYRYDQLMRLGWKVFLPLSLSYILLVGGYFLSFNILPI